MSQKKTLAIIGGGAAGMAAAIEASGQGVHVVLYESQSRLGRKLLATGNGRCNFSHRGFRDSNYHGCHPHFVHDALARFDEADTLAFFEVLGLAWTVDARARYYPESMQASAVLDVLRLVIEERGVELHTDTRITSIRPRSKGGFELRWKGGQAVADAVIVATGGEAAPKLGGTSDGYKLLSALGHTMIETAPGIVQLVCDVYSLKAANGLKRDVRLTLRAEGKTIASDGGELLVTNYGLSGPPVLQCAGHAVRALSEGKRVQAEIDFFPELSEKALRERLQARHAAHPQRRAAAFFVGLLPRLLAQCALKACGIRQDDALDPRRIDALARQLHAWKLPVQGSRGFAEAQVTIGGIDTADFDSASMQSWMVPGLYACGEVLDIDGDCGGYNLQWAWSSGRLAAVSAVSELLNV